ncbi:putative beta-lysine N-acetyltransferase [Kriegella aquimaris]|uniref:Beta-lysine acetyltransferase n=1 Tax=Kriegella aquimaris TaxID=192904 RepID=A0A1G9U5B8_9FLAO|nr:putative beta-lysine N-acetyltransferase [Kriegella aquimaris]SDM55003.1 beta-lysine acetyltransferase [Kriegella aquimaris]
MFDTIERIEGGLVHHGKGNKRVYLLEADHGNWNQLISSMKNLAQQRKYDKIVSRVPEAGIASFQSKGYQVEAKIPGLYNGVSTGYFVADFLNKERSNCAEQKLKMIQSVKTIALAAANTAHNSFMALPDALEIHQLRSEELDELTALARLNERAFRSYPFPIHDKSFLIELLQQGYEFYGLFEKGQLIVASILRPNEAESNMEIVDFVTNSNYRGQNLSYYLVQKIKKKSAERGLKTIYTSVRATSYGLNITFSKHGFSYGGTLLNNTLIGDTMESMNVWYLSLN